MQNQCLKPNVMYRDNVENSTDKSTKIHFDLAETSFKEWFQNNNKDFNHEQKRKKHGIIT